MAKRPYLKSTIRVAPAVNGVQVNFCKKPSCANFGIAALESIKGLKIKNSRFGRDGYTVTSSSAGHRMVPALMCNECNQVFPIKSNLGIVEEQERVEAYLDVPRPVNDACRTAGCINHGVSRQQNKKRYQSIGKTKAGSPRYRCKACNKTIAVKTTTISRQRKSHKNSIIFKCLVNKSPLNRICEITDVSPPTLYRKIDFIYNQCLKFARGHEAALREMEINLLEISSDRQDYLINWSYTQEKRNIVINAIGSADNKSGYVFGMHLNFDQSLKPAEVASEAIASGDYEQKPPFRKFARLWLEPDYAKSAAAQREKKAKRRKGLSAQISEQYGEQAVRDDVEACEQMSTEIRLPENGMLVHGEYTMYGHYRFLRGLLKKTKQFRLYLEQEGAMRAACLSAFVDDIKDHRAEAFYVRINKDLTIHEKDRLRAEGKRELADFIESRRLPAEVSETSARHLLIEERIVNKEFTVMPPYSDKWLLYPYPPRNEAEKMVCWLTDLGYEKHNNFKLAQMYSRATLHGIDRFFQQVRRRISLLERAISTSSNTGRKWYGYCPYNPLIIEKLLTILRIYYNFVLVGEDKKTPAMRLRLTSRAIDVNDILYYMP